MESQEESEMMQDFGSIVRAVMGSGMQMAENAQRRAQMRLSEANAEAERERNVAQMVHRDLSSPQFWKSAGSEAIADRMIVASELAGRHEAASQAFMVGADRIRNQFGINVEDINRDHPTAATDRHRALRDALDDYLAGQRANAEGRSDGADLGRDGSRADAVATDSAGQQAQQEREPLFNTYEMGSNGQERVKGVGKEQALSLLEDLPADAVPEPGLGGRDTISFVQGWYGKDDDVDQAIAEKFPHLVPEDAKLPPENAAAEVAEAKQGEAAQLGQAERFGGEENLDRTNTETAEAKEVTARGDGAKTDSPDTAREQNSPAAQRLLTVWKDKGGKDADFPLAPTTANPQTAMKNRKRVMAGAASARTQGQELSR